MRTVLHLPLSVFFPGDALAPLNIVPSEPLKPPTDEEKALLLWRFVLRRLNPHPVPPKVTKPS